MPGIWETDDEIQLELTAGGGMIPSLEYTNQTFWAKLIRLMPLVGYVMMFVAPAALFLFIPNMNMALIASGLFLLLASFLMPGERGELSKGWFFSSLLACFFIVVIFVFTVVALYDQAENPIVQRQEISLGTTEVVSVFGRDNNVEGSISGGLVTGVDGEVSSKRLYRVGMPTEIGSYRIVEIGHSAIRTEITQVTSGDSYYEEFDIQTREHRPQMPNWARVVIKVPETSEWLSSGSTSLHFYVPPTDERFDF